MKPNSALHLGEITTRWSCVADINRFVLRYTPAMLAYLETILRDADTARDVMHDFLVKIMERGFGDHEQRRGRFRDYLTVAVRNSAISYFRSRRSVSLGPDVLQQLEADGNEDVQWKAAWTECLLHRAWRALEDHQQTNLGNRYHSILRLSTDKPELNSEQAAAILSESGPRLSADSFRQQLRRARIQFAQYLVHEIQETLDGHSRADVVDELRSLGLLAYVRPFLER
ncbi:MAG: sigma-70 family RNA polymerase sigma factor [Planctomycetota bacterium]